MAAEKEKGKGKSWPWKSSSSNSNSSTPSPAPTKGNFSQSTSKSPFPSFTVQGHVLRPWGQPLSGLFVKVVDVDLRSEQLLGGTTSEPDGRYCVRYSAEQPKKAERGTADVKVYVFDSEKSKTPSAASAIFWNAPQECTIDVVVGGDAVVGPAEFDKLREMITPLLDGIPPQDLIEDEKHQDITFLVNETGQPRERIQFFILAYQAQKKIEEKVSVDIFYGLFRNGVATNLSTLLSQDPALLRQALSAAVRDNVIRFRTPAELDAVITQLQRESISHGAGNPENPSPISSILGTVLPKPRSFIEKLSAFNGDTKAFWEGLSSDADLKDKIPATQLAVQLGALTLNHIPLVQELQKRKINDFADLTDLSHSDWTTILQAPGITVPPEIPGDKPEEKVKNYRDTMMNIIEDTFPGKFFASRIAQEQPSIDETSSIPGQVQIATFLQKNKTFDFTKMRLSEFLTNNPDSVNGIDNPDLLKSSLNAVQRVFAVAPRYDQTKALLTQGIHSALQISRMGQSAFLTQFSNHLGGQSEALSVFERAEQTHATAFTLIASFGWPAAHFPNFPVFTEPVISSTTVDAGIPDLTTLFGSLDMCACEECRSVDGPAAYLVDILNYLNDRKLVKEVVRDPQDGHITSVVFRMKRVPGSKTPVPMSVKDALFERRPDVGEIELNCQNTNTPVPYIDLAIEVLENAVAPQPAFKPKDLGLEDPVGVLDSKKVTQDLKNMFDPPLSDYAVITVMRQGEWWTVDEPAYTYTIRRDDSGPVRVISRNTQTKGTAEERAANPQYMNASAYELLKKCVYPRTLPFDMWAATVRTYLAHVDVRRWQVMETLSPLAKREEVLGSADIGHERLGMTPFEAGIVTEASPQEPWALWGFSAASLDETHGIPDPADKGKMITGGRWNAVLVNRVDVFLRQSGLAYKELLNLIQLSDIFAVEEGVMAIKARKGAPVDTCELKALQISGPVNERVLVEIVRFGRILRKIEGWKVLDLGKSVKAVRSKSNRNDVFTEAGLKALLISLSHILRLQERLPDLDLEVILALVSKNLDTTPYKDYENDDEDADTSSFYARTFRNKTVLDRADTVFTGDSATLTGKMMDHISAITAALNIGATDFSRLVKDVLGDDPALSLDNLSTVYRHSVLAQALGLNIGDYLILLKIYPSQDVFASSLETILFIDRANNLLSSSFSLPELNYLLRHDIAPDNPASPQDDVIALTLSDLRSGLQRISTENTFTDDILDQNGDITQKRLAATGWDPKVIAQVIAAFKGTFVWTVPIAVAMPPGLELKVPADIRDKVLYDGSDTTALRLSFAGVMTVAEQTTLTELQGATPEFKAAVDALFAAPRAFFKRNMRTISIPDYKQQVLAMPGSVKIPTTLSKKLYYDSSTKTLHVLGAMTDDERELLLAGTDPVADKDYRDAVLRLFDAPDQPVVVAEEDDKFLSEQDFKDLFDSVKGPGGEENTPLRRFTVALQKLLPRLKRVLGQQYVTQKLAEFLGLEVQITESLLNGWIGIGDQSLTAVLHDESFVQSSANSKITQSVFKDQFVGITKLTKVATFIQRLKLTKIQLGWIFEFRKKTGDPTMKWLDFNTLPVEVTAKGDFEGLEKLLALIRLRDKLPLGEQTLDAIFTMARQQNVRMDDLWAEVAGRTKWSLQDVTTLAGTEGFGFATPTALQDEAALSRIQAALNLLKKVGSSASDGIQYARPEQTEQQARTIVQTVKSKYDLTLWQTVARPLRNILRDAQRRSLVSYMLAHPPPGVKPIWRNSNDLYAYYLMDVEMGPCQLTSRIKQAISITQLFVQRCLMNLEPDIKANSEYDVRWEEWKELKSFRITSAGRQVFQRPENFLEGSNRDDRTNFFKELETDLKQGDLTAEVAETSFMNYLEKLDIVANLEVVSYYHQLESDLTGHIAVDTLHVFARTRATPSIYFYRTLVDRFTWTSWEKVPVDVTGSHVISVVWRRRIHLFWAIITERQEKSAITLPSGSTPLPVGDSYWEIKLAWTEKKEGKWLAKTISDDFILCWKSGRSGFFDEPPTKKSPGRSLLTFKAHASPDTPYLRIDCIQNLTSPHVIGYFFFDGLRGNPRAVISEVDEPWRSSKGDIYIMTPTNTDIKNMSFFETSAKNIKGQPLSDGKVWVYTEDFTSDPLEQNQADLSKNTSQVAVLNSTSELYSIVPPHQDGQFSSQRPFFFLHGTRSFFVEPTDMIRAIPLVLWLGDKNRVHPGLLDGAVWSKYVRKPGIPSLIRPYPGPDVVGLGPRRPTFELGSGLPVLAGPTAAGRTLREATAPRQLDVGGAAATGNLVRGSAVFRPGIPPIEIDASRFRVPIHFPWPTKLKQFKFSLFYHPFVADFIWNLNRDGVDGLLQRPVQMSKVDFFDNTFSPNTWHVSTSEYPADDVDFDNGPMSIYNWELFFHIPLMIAESLSKNQKFAEAQKWFHYIFDPTDTSAMASPQKFWRTKPFFETEAPDYAEQAIGNLLRFLATRGNPEAYASLSQQDKKRLETLEEDVRRWRKDPFNPYLIARSRTTAFQKAVVMKYLDNLIAWGDNLFRMDTIEAINEATQLFMLASNLLGERPAEIPPRAVPRVQTYNTLEPLLDGLSNALVRVEELVPVAPPRGKETVIATNHQIQVATSTMLFFCVPRNDKLLAYWDIVADRLFKIRNCMNLQGVVRELALFEPPIDPALLVKAAASGVDLSSVLSDLNAPLPYHRYSIMAAKAQDVCNELRSLGQAILLALEKKDAEQLSLIRSTHERNTLSAARLVKEKNIQEANSALEALNAGRLVVTERYNYYSTIPFLNAWEITHLSMEGLSLALSIIEAATQPVTASLALIPEIKVGAPTSIGVTYGGQNLSYAASYFGAFLQRTAGLLSKGAAMAGTMGTYARRADDWGLQVRLAQKELSQYDKQIIGASVRVQISEQELKNHDLQLTQQSEIDDYLRSKFNNVDLYDWMLAQLSTTYFQSYQLAYDIAKKAERAYAFELGLTAAPDMIQFGYWDSLKKGLLAGEKLNYSLKNMELSYAALDKREYEITKTISLLQLDPVALIQLKETGSCIFGVPEALFDLDYPGHYFRRIKSVAVTIPCVVGPYTGISSTLTLLKSSTRTSPLLAGGVYRRATNRPDPRFLDSYAQTQDSIATSTGQNDSGMFETNLRDERYLPFERAGAVSSWTLQLAPPVVAQVDTSTIQDVVLHMRYTARGAGEPLRSQAVAELRKSALDAIRIADAQTGLARMFSVRHEFPDAWYQLFSPSSGADRPLTQTAILPLTHPDRFPFLFKAAKSLVFTRIEVFIRVKDAFRKSTHSAEKFIFTIIEEAAPEGTPNEPLGLVEWAGTLRGAKTFAAAGAAKPGKYKLGVGLADGEMVAREALDEIMLVVLYKVTWEEAVLPGG